MFILRGLRRNVDSFIIMFNDAVSTAHIECHWNAFRKSRVKPRKVFRDFKYKSVGRKVQKMHALL